MKSFLQKYLPGLLLLLGPCAGIAQDTAAQPLPGHSAHGEVFDEGPRRRVPLLPGMGKVHFPVTTASPEAQRWFNQGVGQLHGFWYWEAERSFRTVLQLDPTCPMAHWGMAMANLENRKRAAGFIAKVPDSALQALTPREKAWIEAVRNFLDEERKNSKKAAQDWISALENLASNYPDDLEAKAFVLGQQWAQRGHLALGPSSHFAMDAIGQLVLRENPAHPVHHYLIHLWDGDKYARALPAAAQCGPAAPGIAHMWHMSGHIYSGLQRWSDAAWQQEAAARVDHAQMIRTRTMPDQIHNFSHNSEWLVRNLNNLGRVREALAVSTNLISMPRIPRSREVKDQPDQHWSPERSAWSFGTARLRDTLLAWERWDLILEWSQTAWLAEDGETEDRWKRNHLLALAAFRTGDAEKGQEGIQMLRTQLEAVRQERAAAVNAAEQKVRAEGKDGNALQQAMAAALQPFTPRLDAMESAMEELTILSDLEAGRLAEARLKLGKLKGVHSQRMIAMHSDLAEYDKAVEMAGKYADRSEGQVQPQALLVRTLWQAGLHGEAAKAMESLRGLAASADLDTPLLADLKPLAASLGLPEDWRKPAVVPEDVGERPDLDSLGPLAWQGWMAPEWTARAPDGSPVGHRILAGKPYVAILVLGGSCTHCNDQLALIAKEKEAFAQAGLPVVVVTTDPVSELSGKSELTVWSGGDGASFRALDAWDDFENKPMHATVLVDAAGRVRWQHSGYEPLMNTGFLRTEARRLLDLEGSVPRILAGRSIASDANPNTQTN